MALAFISGYTITNRTSIARRTTVTSSMSESGVLRFVDLGATKYFVLRVSIDQITEADKETLLDWLVTNELTEIDLTVSTHVYRGYIDPSAGITSNVSQGSSHLWDVEFGFIGVKQ